MIGEDDGPVALGDASHGHMEDTMWSLDVMLLQPEKMKKRCDECMSALGEGLRLAESL